MQKTETLIHTLQHMPKNSHKMDHILKCKAKIIKFLRENIGQKFLTLAQAKIS